MDVYAFLLFSDKYESDKLATLEKYKIFKFFKCCFKFEYI